jgi:hypothetical protein
MQTHAVVPPGLHDIFLGYGDPGAAHYSRMPTQLKTINFLDTFVSREHLLASFPGHAIELQGDSPLAHVPPFRVRSQYEPCPLQLLTPVRACAGVVSAADLYRPDGHGGQACD